MIFIIMIMITTFVITKFSYYCGEIKNSSSTTAAALNAHEDDAIFACTYTFDIEKKNLHFIRSNLLIY
jgi:hypothetical protein